MAGAVAQELLTNQYVDETIVAFEAQCLVQTVAETTIDYEARLQASHFIGSVLCGQEAKLTPAEHQPATKPTESLYDALKLIEQRHDPEALEMVRMNVLTDRVERQIKAGHIGQKIALHEDENGRIQQFGQSIESVQANSLRQASPNMLPRVKAEARNAFRIQHAKDEGLLHDYYFAVVSLAADDMSPKELSEAGFFTKTMSLTVQFNSVENGKMVIEPAFIAGKTSETASRSDKTTIVEVGKRLNVDLANKNAAELIDTPIFIHKSLMPNGVADFVKLYDECAGGTFFGQDTKKPKATTDDYIRHRQHCAELEQAMTPKVQEVTQKLIAMTPEIQSPSEACEQLARLNGEVLVRESIHDRSIDPAIFGADAAWRIELGRHHFEQGNIEQSKIATNEAVKKERSSSCPGGSGKREAQANSSDDKKDKDEKAEKLDDCEFVSKQCPVCGDKPAKTKVKNGVFYHVGKPCKS